MVIPLDSGLDNALREMALRQAGASGTLVVNARRQEFLVAASLQPRDEWERGLLAAERECGVSLPASALKQRRTVRIMAYLIDTSILARIATAVSFKQAELGTGRVKIISNKLYAKITFSIRRIK